MHFPPSSDQRLPSLVDGTETTTFQFSPWLGGGEIQIRFLPATSLTRSQLPLPSLLRSRKLLLRLPIRSILLRLLGLIPLAKMSQDKGPDVVAEEQGKENLTENGPPGGGNHDELLQMIAELRIENDFLRSQFKDQVEGDRAVSQPQVDELQGRLASLSREVDVEKQTRVAAEQALEHLREAYSEADAKAQEYSSKFSQVQQKLEQEIKEREEKYADLDAKFTRLHKRAKQRIQEIQKEKDDLDARFREVSDSAERASSQHSSMQQELERTRQQANEALKAMDAERQQLRSANNKLRDTIEELRGSLQPKENKIETLQQSLLDKDQVLEDLKKQLQAVEERKQTAVADLSAKHQKNLESLEAQVIDALSERDKAAQNISALQVQLAEKESKIAEMEAAATGEAARLRAAAETLKGELSHLKAENEKEKETWEASCDALKSKLEIAESNYLRAEMEVAKMRSQLGSEMSMQTQILSTKDAELKSAREEINSLQSEFSSYKIRAHALLQKKDMELAAAKDSEQIRSLEEALKEAEKEVYLVSAERDRARQDLQGALASLENEVEERAGALKDANEQIKRLELKLDSTVARNQAEKQAWEEDLRVLEETWRRRCEALTAQNEAFSAEDIVKELEDSKLRNKRLKEEHESVRELADRLIEEKDREISRLVDENKNLRKSMEPKPVVHHYGNNNTESQQQDVSNLNTSAAEHQILILARQQAQREEELAQTQRHILALQEEIEELERENRLHSQQEALLKTELREMERKQKREGVDMTYLKNVILKLLETGEVEALLPVVGMLLQFSPEEAMEAPRHKLHSGLRLWEFPDQYVIEPTDGSGASCLDISRLDGSMKLIGLVSSSVSFFSLQISVCSLPGALFPLFSDHVAECNSLRVPKIRSIFGVVGTLKLLAGSYLVVVTESESVGSFLGHPIFRINSLKVLPCDLSLKDSPEEQKKMETDFSSLLSVAERTTGLYFSYEINLTLTAQRLHDLGDDSKSLPLWRQAEPRFLWNNYMLEVLIDNKLFHSPLISSISSACFQTAIGRDIVDITLIARRCTRRNGTRMWRRGADPDGYVANFVETEQIVHMNGYTSSFVQVRGSMPFMWEQIVDLTYKPKFEIVQPEEAARIAERHFLDLRKKYGSVLAVDLVNKHGGEGRLSERFAGAVQHIAGDDVRYLHFDFHRICGHIHFERLAILYDQMEDFLEKNGYFLLNEKGEKMKGQLGIVRTNCIDCLDRTNVTQASINIHHHVSPRLFALLLILYGQMQSMIVWANHGDDISIQYSGTPALKGDFVRYGQRTVQGVLKDGWNALARYYLNNFADGTKQDAIDLVQGHYIVAVNRDMAPVPRKGGLEAVANLPVALAVVLISFWLATMSLKRAGSDYRHLVFSLVWAGISVAVTALVRANARIFCNRPRLHRPRS
ncbi:unnamed protein product [Thlaspi arvense]|uniref:SAC domain-containing protein n=1 Tax=Thlaspi arvense TaxID=13288 RepID=A0AAU9RI36_THLAR|nr:unnamed protein product [Thlaspi arvense]